jgi:hypothetical protein
MQTPSWQVNSPDAGPETIRHLRNSKGRTHKSPSSVPVHNQVRHVHEAFPYFFNIHLTLLNQPHPRLSSILLA